MLPLNMSERKRCPKYITQSLTTKAYQSQTYQCCLYVKKTVHLTSRVNTRVELHKIRPSEGIQIKHCYLKYIRLDMLLSERRTKLIKRSLQKYTRELYAVISPYTNSPNQPYIKKIKLYIKRKSWN
jgi:hypothetical protein